MPDQKISQRTPAATLTISIARLATARGFGDVVGIIRSTARQLIGCQGIAIIRLEGDLCHYIEEDAIGPLWKGNKFPASACISGWAMIHRQTVVVPDISLDERIPFELYQGTFVRAVMIAPVGRDAPTGAIGAYWAQPYAPTSEEVELLEALAGAAATAIENIRLIQELSEALKDAEFARDELKHRVKNVYMGAKALAALSLPRKEAADFSDRLVALATAHQLLDDHLSSMNRIGMFELIDAELAPYRTGDRARVSMIGPEVNIGSATAIALGLVINELATNAVKYGSLSLPEGSVSIIWSYCDGLVDLGWTEAGGPEPSGEAVESVGSGLLQRLVEGQLRGKLDRRMESTGVVCHLSFRTSAAAATVRTSA